MILLLISLTPIPSKRLAILELLKFCADRLQVIQGCLNAGVYEAADESRAILYMEQWVSSNELHRHIQSDLYRGVLAALDLADGPPDISFHEVSSTQSMELIEALRGAHIA